MKNWRKFIFENIIRYNNSDNIVYLIKKLEKEMPNITSNKPKINQDLEQRRQKNQ